MKTEILENPSWMILNALPNVGPVAFKRLIAQFGTNPERIFGASRAELMRIEGIGEVISGVIANWRNYFDLESELDQLIRHRARFISCQSEEYSPLLKEIYDPPIGLYCLGDYKPSTKTIAIVGSRRSTLYGLKIAKQLAIELSRLGFCIVSGMARGADSAAHEGVLSVGGKTVAVLGSGPDVIYPPENKDLYNRIRESGAIISEFSFGKQADKTTFPRRNRIVSGMSQAIIVVETSSNGGSMITARMAGEQGRHVFAVPGRIDQASSNGCHELIRDGATLCTGVDVILEELCHLSQTRGPIQKEFAELLDVIPSGLSEIEKKVFTALKAMSVSSIDGLSANIQEPAQKVSSTLLMLELKKLASKRTDGAYEIMPALI